MSYEGYVQLLCPNGHNWNIDCYQFDTSYYAEPPEGTPPSHLCPYCKQKYSWWNSVDQTNCDEHGYIELEIDKSAVICKCDKCGIEHTVEPVRYKIPPPDAREKAIEEWCKKQEEQNRKTLEEMKKIEERQKEGDKNLGFP